MRIVDRYFYRCDELFLALGAGDAVDDMLRLKGKKIISIINFLNSILVHVMQ